MPNNRWKWCPYGCGKQVIHTYIKGTKQGYECQCCERVISKDKLKEVN